MGSTGRERVGEIRAAGGVVVRQTPGGLEVVAVHRPRYDDWSLPKGKLDPGESFEEAALREVSEETGLECELIRELESVRYRDGHGRPKIARYWLMRPVGGRVEDRAPDDEVDELRWVTVPEAVALLSYSRDRDLVLLASSFESRPHQR